MASLHIDEWGNKISVWELWSVSWFFPPLRIFLISRHGIPYSGCLGVGSCLWIWGLFATHVVLTSAMWRRVDQPNFTMFLRDVGVLHRTTRRHIHENSTFTVTARRATNAVILMSLTKPVTRNVLEIFFDMWRSHGGGYDVTIYQTTRRHIPQYISINTDRTIHNVLR
jgi:hypothetical protein